VADPTQEQKGSELTGAALVRYIFQSAQGRHLDPQAVLGVASAEGGFYGAVGDSGSSFGPFQLHIGGALPSVIAAKGPKYAATWANTPSGINYALDRIGLLARGQGNVQAVESIISGFEKPHDYGVALSQGLPPNIAASRTRDFKVAMENYGKFTEAGQGAGSAPGGLHIGFSPAGGVSGVNSVLRHVPGVAQAEDAAGGAVSAFNSVEGAIGWISKPTNIGRVGEVIGGAFLVLVCLVLLGFGVVKSQPVQQTAGTVAAVAR
jgi:hypothetical protein